MSITTVIHSATAVEGGQMISDFWLAVGADGLIATTGTGDNWPRGCRDTVDAGGMLLMPGVIDTHVHFRDPGLTRKADFATESLAAAAGGVTSVIDMPNTTPPTTSLDAWEQKMAMGAAKSAVNYAFFLGATNSNADSLLRADFSRVAGIKLFLGSSTGDMLVDSRPTIERIFAEAPALVAVHAESERLVREGRQHVVGRYGEGVEIPISEHPAMRPRQACYEAAALAVEMARRHGTRLHLLHLSTADELSLLGNDADRGLITSETCPHYLWFDSADYATLGSRIKCNPAIKDAADRKALTAALASGLIDTVATDHAPHLPADKAGDALHAASGMPGIDMSLRVMLELTELTELSVPRVVDAMCRRPAEIFGIDRRGRLTPGWHADLVLVSRDAEADPVGDADSRSKCGWSPYAGATLHWHVRRTMVNGYTVFDGTGARRVNHAAQALQFAR